MSKVRVLVAEDDDALRQLLKDALPENGYEVAEASDGLEAIEVFHEQNPDVVLLDITMPGLDGFEVLRRLRQISGLPIIMLSGRRATGDKVRALSAGADDYLTKPFDLRELIVRIEVAMRRRGQRAAARGKDFDDGRLVIDFETRRVSVGGREIALTPREYDLLREFVINVGKSLSKRHLLASVWGPEYAGDDSLLYPHVARLREKIELDPSQPKYIVTDRRVGYRFQGLINQSGPDPTDGEEHPTDPRSDYQI